MACAALISDVCTTLLDSIRPIIVVAMTTNNTNNNNNNDDAVDGGELARIVECIIDDDSRFFRAQYRSHASLFDTVSNRIELNADVTIKNNFCFFFSDFL